MEFKIQKSKAISNGFQENTEFDFSIREIVFGGFTHIIRVAIFSKIYWRWIQVSSQVFAKYYFSMIKTNIGDEGSKGIASS